MTLYVGPSAYGVAPETLSRGRVRVRPPARRGDIDRLTAKARSPGVIVLCDGVFHTAPAVSHAELARALDGGWRLWGVSSIGAIRAYEMRHEGMHGSGWVHAQFARHADFTDDEMALLHFPETPYFPLTEPLVNLRHAFEQKGRALAISVAAEHETLRILGSLWFGERTTKTIRSVMVRRAGIPATSADALLAWLTTHRIKTMDLIELMAKRPWHLEHVRAVRSSRPATPTGVHLLP